MRSALLLSTYAFLGITCAEQGHWRAPRKHDSKLYILADVYGKKRVSDALQVEARVLY